MALRWLLQPLLGGKRILILPSAFWEALRTEEEHACGHFGQVHPEQKRDTGSVASWPRGHLDAAPSCARAVRHLVISRCPCEPPRTRSAHIWVDCRAAPSSTSPAALHVPPDTFSHLRQDGDEYVPLPTWVTTDRLRITHGPVLTGRTEPLPSPPAAALSLPGAGAQGSDGFP